jgi:NAD(P)-dependent dehydrogenase (short-subunit alcohol dehydrogenase family)
MDLFELKGKNAVILGGGGILGASMVKGLVGAGANVAVCDLRRESAEALAQSVAASGVRTKGYGLVVGLYGTGLW